jgi:hypothetical protein
MADRAISVLVRAHPHLYEINTIAWLSALSRRAGARVTLGTVPAAEWDRLRARGIDIVYLMGVWKRSEIGRQMAVAEQALYPAYDAALPGWTAGDIAGSAYCVSAYEPDERAGSWDDFARARHEIHSRGMQLMADFIPNHTGFDHPWIAAHPDRYVTASEAVHQLSPASFRAVTVADGSTRYVACARDPYFPPWSDVAQLDYSNPDTQSAMIAALKDVATRVDGVRCDMAMLVLSDVFERTWGDVTRRSPTREFWQDAAAAVPNLTLLAEVYWDLEWRLQQLGFHYTYDKRLYDLLLHRSADEVRVHLDGDVDFQRRSARFIENHDEPRAVEAFGNRVTSAAVTMATIPGLRFFHDGQFDGRRARVPVQLASAADVPIDERLDAFYGRLLAAANDEICHSGAWSLATVTPCDDSPHTLLAWRWRDGNSERLVIVNLGSAPAHGYILVRPDLGPGDAFEFHDVLDDKRYVRARGDLESEGLYVRLDAGQSHIFSVSPVTGREGITI